MAGQEWLGLLGHGDELCAVECRLWVGFEEALDRVKACKLDEYRVLTRVSRVRITGGGDTHLEHLLVRSSHPHSVDLSKLGKVSF
jgi:hypothetical protein